MDVRTSTMEITTNGYTELIDLTPKIEAIIRREGFDEGMAGVFAIGSTCAISTIEYEPGLIHHDIRNFWEQLAPYHHPYHHNRTWGDNNGAAHIRSFLTGTSQIFPCVNGKLLLGTWQQIVLIDYDTQPRHRRIIIQLIGHFKSALSPHSSD